MKTLVVLHVTPLMSYLVMILGHVRVMGAGMVLRLCVEKVWF